MTTIYGWHFLYEGHKLRNGTTAPKDGEWLEVKNPAICVQGLHGSLTPYDALKYAPGPILCLCEFSEPVDQHEDKFVSERRRIIARMDATEMLRYYARIQALSVVHMWDAPDIILDYLMTGDERIRASAMASARGSTMDAAKASAMDAAMDAAMASARGSAMDAAVASAMDAVVASVVASASASARASAMDAVVASARGSAMDAAMDAAKADFNSLVFECFEGPMKASG